jgi:ATP-binding cassette subfamily F protein 2
MIADGLIEPVEREHVVPLKFPDPDELSPPVLAFQQVGFAYSGKPEDMLYSNVEFGIDLESRVVSVQCRNSLGCVSAIQVFAGSYTSFQLSFDLFRFFPCRFLWDPTALGRARCSN